MRIDKKANYLITTDNYFFGPDGKAYRAVWGPVEILSDEVLGIITNRNSTNWFIKCGDKENHIIVAGCQINYVLKCNNRPCDDMAETWNIHEGKAVTSYAPCSIWFYDEEY
jgi:hypothetical protein